MKKNRRNKRLPNGTLSRFIYISLLITLPVIGQPILMSESWLNQYTDYLINQPDTLSQAVLQQPWYKMQSGNIVIGYYPFKLFRYHDHLWGENKNTAVSVEASQGLQKTSEYIYAYQYDFNFAYHSDYLSLFNRTTVDSRFGDDPQYAGDLSEAGHWIYGRVEDAFLDYNKKPFEIFLGRTRRNWGPPSAQSLLLSSYAYSFDHIYFSYKRDRIKLTLLAAPLDDMEGIEYLPRDSAMANLGNSKRYLSMHRLDLEIAPTLQMGFSEAAVYGGPNRSWELSYLNPMTFYYGVQRNDRKQMSGLWLMDIVWKPQKKITLYQQLLIDDIIINNDPGVNDRARWPDRLGVQTALHTADLFFQGLSVNLTYTKIWNQTYQSFRNYENYIYRGLGIGYPVAGAEEVKISSSYWHLYPFLITNEMVLGRYGDVKLTDIFIGDKVSFPRPPVRKIFADVLSLSYLWRWNLSFDANIRYFSDGNHYLNRQYNYRTGLEVEFQVTWLLNSSFNL